MPTFPPAVAKYAEPDDVTTVVEAYGKTEAVVDVAVKYPATTSPPNTAEPPTESWRYGDVVPMPTLPLAMIVKSVDVELSEEEATVRMAG
jgi:hypothetical protein